MTFIEFFNKIIKEKNLSSKIIFYFFNISHKKVNHVMNLFESQKQIFFVNEKGTASHTFKVLTNKNNQIIIFYLLKDFQTQKVFKKHILLKSYEDFKWLNFYLETIAK